MKQLKTRKVEAIQSTMESEVLRVPILHHGMFPPAGKLKTNCFSGDALAYHELEVSKSV